MGMAWPVCIYWHWSSRNKDIHLVITKKNPNIVDIKTIKTPLPKHKISIMTTLWKWHNTLHLLALVYKKLGILSKYTHSAKYVAIARKT